MGLQRGIPGTNLFILVCLDYRVSCLCKRRIPTYSAADQNFIGRLIGDMMWGWSNNKWV